MQQRYTLCSCMLEQQHVGVAVVTQKTSAEANNLQGHLDIVRDLYHPQHSSSLEDRWEIWDC